MADILHLLKIHAPRATAYAAIATVEGVRNWFSRDADFDATIGSTGEIRFANGQRITRIRIEELEPVVRVAWQVLAAPMPTWPSTRIEFELGADDTGTILHFAHRGFRETDDYFALSTTAWATFLLSLKAYLETGHGTPHPDDVLSRVAGSVGHPGSPTARQPTDEDGT